MTGCERSEVNHSKICLPYSAVQAVMSMDESERKARGLNGCKMDFGTPAVGKLNNDCVTINECADYTSEKMHCASFTGCGIKTNDSTGKCVPESFVKNIPADAAEQKYFGLDCTVKLINEEAV